MKIYAPSDNFLFFVLSHAESLHGRILNCINKVKKKYFELQQKRKKKHKTEDRHIQSLMSSRGDKSDGYIDFLFFFLFLPEKFFSPDLR